MKREVTYEYQIDLQNYQIREDDPDIVLYSRRYRESFITCLRRCKNKRLETERRKELKKGSKIYLYIPNGRVKGYMVLTARGRIRDYGVWGKRVTWKQSTEILIRLFYACLNDAALNINMPVRFRVPVKYYMLNKHLENVWLTIGCKIKVVIRYFWVPKELTILNKSYKTWKRQDLSWVVHKPK